MADPDSSLTPEQRLLKTIEDGSAPKDEAAVAEPTKEIKSGFSFKNLLSPVALLAKLQHARDQTSQLFKEKDGQLQLKQVNKYLQIAVILVGVILTGSILMDLRLLQKDYLADFDVSQRQMADISFEDGLQAKTTFLDGYEIRNIFKPYERRSEQATEATGVSLRILDIADKLRLTGISVHPTDDSRTYCMIEDVEKDLTTFLRVGDTISGLSVAQIKQDSILLAYKDETIEIR